MPSRYCSSPEQGLWRWRTYVAQRCISAPFVCLAVHDLTSVPIVPRWRTEASWLLLRRAVSVRENVERQKLFRAGAGTVSHSTLGAAARLVGGCLPPIPPEDFQTRMMGGDVYISTAAYGVTRIAFSRWNGGIMGPTVQPGKAMTVQGDNSPMPRFGGVFVSGNEYGKSTAFD